MRKDPVSGLYATKDGLVYRTVGRWRDGSKRLAIAATRDNHGYLRTCMKNSQFVHRVVYRAFKGEIPAGMQIDHIDGNKRNNAISNLQLLTPSENSKKAWAMGASKINTSQFKAGFTPWNKGLSGRSYTGHYQSGFHNQYI